MHDFSRLYNEALEFVGYDFYAGDVPFLVCDLMFAAR